MTTPYRTGDVMAALDCTRALLNSWMQRQLIVPTIPAQGSGRPSQWSLEDIILARAIKTLGDAGMDLRTAKEVVEDILYPQTAKYVKVDLTGTLEAVLTLCVEDIRLRVIAKLEEAGHHP